MLAAPDRRSRRESTGTRSARPALATWRIIDLFLHDGGRLIFVPAEHMHDPEQARHTAERLLDLDFAVLCSGHGMPVTDDPKSAIRAALGEAA